MIPIRPLCAFACLLGAVLHAGPASAETSAISEPVGFAAQAVDADTLASQRGGSTQVNNDMTLAGTTADNTATHVTTGNNAISSGSFANMSGMPVVIQNSGANVLIQSAVILNLQMN